MHDLKKERLLPRNETVFIFLWKLWEKLTHSEDGFFALVVLKNVTWSENFNENGEHHDFWTIVDKADKIRTIHRASVKGARLGIIVMAYCET